MKQNKKRRYTMSEAALRQRREAGFEKTGRTPMRSIKMPVWMLAEILAATPEKKGATWRKIWKLIKKEEKQT